MVAQHDSGATKSVKEKDHRPRDSPWSYQSDKKLLQSLKLQTGWGMVSLESMVLMCLSGEEGNRQGVRRWGGGQSK